MKPRLFLVAPDTAEAETVADCARAAAHAGDVASIVLPATLLSLTADLQHLGLAVLCQGEHGDVEKFHCDGVQVMGGAAVIPLRKSYRSQIIGAHCGISRHEAMQAAEAGADYVALSQSGVAAGGERLITWWSDLFEIPCVAADPVTVADLAILLPQNPDFIRPSDEMWRDEQHAGRVIAELMQAMSQA